MFSNLGGKGTFWTKKRPKGDQILHILAKKDPKGKRSPKGDLVFHPASNFHKLYPQNYPLCDDDLDMKPFLYVSDDDVGIGETDIEHHFIKNNFIN